MIQVLRELLLSDSVMHTIVSTVLARYCHLHVDADAFVASVAEIISDIREPITVQRQEMGREERRQLDLKVCCPVRNTLRVVMSCGEKKLDKDYSPCTQEFTSVFCQYMLIVVGFCLPHG